MPASKIKRTASSRKALSRRIVASRSGKVPARLVRSTEKENIWTKQHFYKEQEDFFRAHPNSKVLIAMFTGALALFLYIVWSNKLELFPQAFIW